MDLADHIGQPGMPDRALRGRGDQMRVVARFGHRQRPAGDLDGEPFSGHHCDGREPPFGSVGSLSSSTARRAIASSVSSYWMRSLAAVNAAFSFEVVPGSRPRSMRS
jgi:hypothetical protein